MPAQKPAGKQLAGLLALAGKKQPWREVSKPEREYTARDHSPGDVRCLEESALGGASDSVVRCHRIRAARRIAHLWRVVSSVCAEGDQPPGRDRRGRTVRRSWAVAQDSRSKWRPSAAEQLQNPSYKQGRIYKGNSRGKVARKSSGTYARQLAWSGGCGDGGGVTMPGKRMPRHLNVLYAARAACANCSLEKSAKGVSAMPSFTTRNDAKPSQMFAAKHCCHITV